MTDGLPGWRVFTRDSDRQLTGQIDVAQELRWTPVLCRGATWSLSLPPGPQAALLPPGAGIVAYGPDSDRPSFSGPVTTLGRASATDGQLVTFSGIDDTARLAERIVWPDPDNVWAAQSAAYWTALGVPSETVLKALVQANAGSLALLTRQLGGLVVASNMGRGAPVSVSLRFDNLLDALQGAAGGLGFQVVQDGLELVFDVYEPRDLHAVARFSAALGNLQSYEYALTAPQANVALVAAQGEGAARELLEVAGEVGPFGDRVERFVDRRDTSDDGTLEQAGLDDLATGATQAALTMGPVDSQGLRFGRDYNLGDVVTVELGEGVAVVDVIRQVEVIVTAAAVTSTPTIGGPNASDGSSSAQLVRIVKQLSTRLRALEARL